MDNNKLLKDAKKGNPRALEAVLYLFEEKCKGETFAYLAPDAKKAKPTLEDPVTLYALVFLSERLIDDKENIKLIKKSANMGFTPAIMWYARYIRYNGNRSTAPKAKSQYANLVIKAANLGNQEGMIEAARCYKDGSGVPKNIPEAISWFERAAEKGSAEASFELGKLAFAGTPNMQKSAMDYILMAEKAGDDSARQIVSLLS